MESSNLPLQVWPIAIYLFSTGIKDMSSMKPHRYIGEFEGRYNARALDTIDQMRLISMGMHGKRLKYNELAR